MSRTRTAGYTLIEMMIALSILGIGTSVLVRHFGHYQQSARRARAVAAVTQVLDQELERARACRNQACVRALSTLSSTTSLVAAEGYTWARPHIIRRVRPGPDQTLEVTLSAEIPEVMSARTLVTLVRVER